MTSTISGILLVTVAGLLIGSMSWPMKVCRRLAFEHQWLLAMLAGLVVLPWTITLLSCPAVFAAYHDVGSPVLLKANAFSLAWGLANVLMGICIVRLGAGLTFAILTGIGSTLGVLIPLIFKASGLFAQAPGLNSPSGAMILAGAAVMLGGVALTCVAGLNRDRPAAKNEAKHGSFLTGLLMVIAAGLLSCGISFTFIFSQGPIVEAVRARGAGEIGANASVWAVALMGGALVNIIYPLVLLFRNRSWSRFVDAGAELLIAPLIGIQFFIGVLLMGKGMVLLGVLGASVGFGIAQGLQIIGGQIVGFSSDEWKDAENRPRNQMLLALVLILVAVTIMAAANYLAGQ